MPKTNIGTIAWVDLTVKNAEKVRDFYANVIGWKAIGIKMGGYQDFCMNSNKKTIAGICHARGKNADLPAQWLMYVTVKDLKASITQVKKLGGKS